MIRGDLINLVKYEFGKIIEDEEILDPIEVIRLYHPNGQCSDETVYKNGIKHGVFREFNTSGKITDGGYFDQGVLEAKRNYRQRRKKTRKVASVL